MENILYCGDNLEVLRKEADALYYASDHLLVIADFISIGKGM